jgi:hypothetical protein
MQVVVGVMASTQRPDARASPSSAPADDHHCPRSSSPCQLADAPLSRVHQQTITTEPAAASIVNTPVPLPPSAPADDRHRT